MSAPQTTETAHTPLDVYEMPDESVETLLDQIDNGTAVLAFRLCAACAPQDVLDRVEEGTLDLSDGDALAAQWPCDVVVLPDGTGGDRG